MGSNGQLWDELSLQWLSGLKNADRDLVSKIWAALEAESFSIASLARLDNSLITEKLLWPTFDDNAPNQHVYLLAVFINYKKESRLLSWPAFREPADQFSHLFSRILSLCLDPSTTTTCRLIALNFIITTFQSLEQEVARKECAPLVSIATWENLHSEAFRDAQLDLVPSRRKAWRGAKKRFDSANDDGKLKMRLERAWLFNMVLDFFRRINGESSFKAEFVYCSRFLELLIDLVSQLPTRRYAIVLLRDLNVVPLLKLSAMYRKRENDLIRDLTSLFELFCGFQIDDTGEAIASRTSTHSRAVARLQTVALKNFEEKLKVLALSNVASISKYEDLKPLLEVLTDAELEQLCALLDMRMAFPPSAGIPIGRSFFLESLLCEFTAAPDVHKTMDRIAILPTESSLYDPTLLQNETYNGIEPLALPKLNLQYLTLNDFLWRSFQLQQAEAFYEIRKDMESIVRKVKPQMSRDSTGTTFGGFSKMAIPIDKPAIIDVSPPNVGDDIPSHVRAEVVLDVSRLGDKVRQEWDNLKPKDTVFLLAVQPVNAETKTSTNGSIPQDQPGYHGIQLIRTAEVVQVQDEKGKPLRDPGGIDGHASRARTRRLLLDLDARAFKVDKGRLSSGKSDVYKTINLIARRPGRENNFKPLLESIRNLMLSDARLPAWLQEVYLGYGQPDSATYPRLEDKIDQIDYLDTFLDWDHIQESFPNQTLHHDGDHTPTPPYVLHLQPSAREPEPTNRKKRRRGQMEVESEGKTCFRVSSYQPPNTGPYPVDHPKKNLIRFTARQVQALVTGAQPGLSLIVGPPGTGKTDVATQLINVLYHNFPEERILLIAHSNQALNQLFQKIVALDIDQRHLLRLGHGEEDLETEGSFGKAGRVESFMESRQLLLSEVNRLAVSIGAPGAHGDSCETADYFDQVFVQPAWTRFWHLAKSEDATSESIINAFPFRKFFATAPIPELFPTTSTVEQVRDIARGCHHHINKLFADLAVIRPFELLRHPRDQSNHLLTSTARIIAMTSTHAAIRRSEIASLGFKYDTLIMEEAAQITEIESFIPCAMQDTDAKTGELPLKRIVLVGDHLQNSPIVQNFALRDYANLEQSLFLRLIRLGVPHVMLDAQGRCRPSLTSLFSFRYPGLKDLPLTSQPIFTTANAGFKHVCQFINVEDYQGTGEREPSPHFIQNLGEAEYAVALYQYMRLLGYPASSITILAAYAGQRALIRDVLDHRCKTNRLFGLPRSVSTVDKYQGEQNDYVILSLTRTKTPGYLRDIRRLTVALSRARLGLYILGRRTLFADLPGLDVATRIGNPDGHLEVVVGETHPTSRGVGDGDGASDADKAVPATEIHGLEHLGQYVFEMTQAKIKSLGGNISLVGPGAGDADADGIIEAEAVVEEDDDEEDALHENV